MGKLSILENTLLRNISVDNQCFGKLFRQVLTYLIIIIDYIAAGKLDPEIVVDVVRGLSTACGQNNCALIGGETAEMPGLYHGDDFDLAGTIVGMVDRSRIIDGTGIIAGDVVFALPSSGLHTNGYSLVRKLLFDELKLDVGDYVDEFGCTVADELLKVHLSYLAQVTELSTLVDIKGLAHITGGGFYDNLPRVLPRGCGAKIRNGSWPVLPVFKYLQEKGSIADNEMYRVFNMGMGMLIVVGVTDADNVPDRLSGMLVYRVGEITSGEVIEII